MLSIQECLENIKSAVFGRDVRQSIHDGIKRINDESKEDMKKKQDTIDIYTDKMDLLNDKYEEQIKNITFDSPSDYEIVDSRRTRENTVYATLKQRLDEDKNSIWVEKEATGIVTLEETPDGFGKLTICEGKNLMTNTNFSKGTEGWMGANGTTLGLVNHGGRTVLKIDTSTSSIESGYVYQTTNNVELDTMYTLEVDAYVETAKYVIFSIHYLKNGWHKIDSKRFPVTTGWNKIYFTFKSDPTINNIISEIGCFKGEVIYVYHPCLTKGTEARGWTPTPEEGPKIEQPVLDKNELFITPVISSGDLDALTGPDIVKIEKDENLNFIIEPQYFHSLCNDILEEQGGSQGTLEFPVDLTVKVSYLSATTTKVNQFVGKPEELNTTAKTIASAVNELKSMIDNVLNNVYKKSETYSKSEIDSKESVIKASFVCTEEGTKFAYPSGYNQTNCYFIAGSKWYTDNWSSPVSPVMIIMESDGIRYSYEQGMAIGGTYQIRILLRKF